MATYRQQIKDEDKELLLSRVLELVFIDGVAGFECRRCNRTLIRHHTANCGHKFCANCKSFLLNSKSNCPLPACKKPIKNIDLQDVDFERKLYDLRAHCPNQRYGCPFNSQLKDLGSHLRKCKDTKDGALPVLIKQNEEVKIGEVLRELNSKFDKLSADVMEIQNSTKEVDKKIRDMITDVDEKINKFELHIDKKLKTVVEKIDEKMIIWTEELDEKENVKQVDIKLMNMKSDIQTYLMNNGQGDKVKLSRNLEMVNVAVAGLTHKVTQQAELLKLESAKTSKVIEEMNVNVKEKVREFIPALVNKFDDQMSECNRKIKKLANENEKNKSLIKTTKKIKQKINHLDQLVLQKIPQINCFNLVVGKCDLQPDFSWRINGIRGMVECGMSEAISDAFKWTGYPVRTRAKLQIKEDNAVYLSLCLEDHRIDLRPIPTVYYVLRNQSWLSVAQHRGRSAHYLFGSKFNDQSSIFEQTLVHRSWLTHPLYYSDDSITIDVYIEPPSMAQLVHSHDGTLSWAIDSYRKRRRMAIKELVYYHESPYIYTGSGGYRLRVRMWLNGHVEYSGKGLTAQVSLITGRFDEALTQRTTLQMTVTLLNRKCPDKSITKKIDIKIEDKREIFINMCSHSAIESLLNNDMLFYKILILRQM